MKVFQWKSLPNDEKTKETQKVVDKIFAFIYILQLAICFAGQKNYKGISQFSDWQDQPSFLSML
jgi:hypothetical protein